MTEPRPAPYPADTLAKGWGFELRYERIERSATWAVAGPEGQAWALKMWMLAWRQAPCGSWENDEEVIAGSLGMSAAQWAKHRKALMRGWWLADDGRLYHNTITELVLAMMRKRRSDADRQHAQRERDRLESRSDHVDITPESRVTHTDVGRESSTDNRQPKKTVSDEPNGSSSSVSPTRPARRTEIPPPYSDIVSAYHAALPDLPRAKLMPEARKRLIAKAWRWVLTSSRSDGTRRATNAEEGLAWLAEYFALAAQNDFITGRSPRSAEHAGWRADIDYLLSDKGMRQVIEKTQERAA